MPNEVSPRWEEGEKRKKRDEERKIDIKVSSRRETKRRNRMLLKAAFIMKIDNNRRYEGKDYY